MLRFDMELFLIAFCCIAGICLVVGTTIILFPFSLMFWAVVGIVYFYLKWYDKGV